MKRIKTLLLCLVLLGLAGILHHEWLQKSGTCTVTDQTLAAELSNDQGASCNGTGTWHFVNNHVGAVLPAGTITVDFTNCPTEVASAFKINPNGDQQFIVQTSGNCSLEDASTDLPGKLVLSDFVCVAGTPTPTPSPSPSPSPSPTP
jgi:hypothetical protein